MNTLAIPNSDTPVVRNHSGTVNLLYKHNSGAARVQNLNSKATEDGDQLAISPALAALTRSGLNLRSSSVEASHSSLEFRLSFSSNSQETLSAEGYYASEEKSLSLSLRYTMQRAEVQDGKLVYRSYEATLDIRAEQFRTTSLTPFREKEDIIGFVRRVVQDIMDTAKDDKKILNGVLFDAEDLQDIAAIKDGELAKAVSAIVSMAMHLSAMKKLTENPEENREPVVLHPKRIVQEGIDAEQTERNTFSFDFSLREIGLTSENPPQQTENIAPKDTAENSGSVQV